MWRCLAVAAVVVTWGPRPADACSCDPTIHLSPADGATEVPRNVEIVLRDVSWFLPDYVLRGPDGEEVPIEVENLGSTHVLRPLALLAAGTAYTIEAQTLPVPPAFTTGADEDLDAPAAPLLGDLFLASAPLTDEIGFSCGDTMYDVDLDVSLAPDVATVEITVDSPSGLQEHLFLPEELAWLGGWNSGCGPDLPVLGGADHVVTIRARDAAGNVSEVASRTASAIACPVIPDPDCTELDRGLAGCADGYDGCPDRVGDGGAGCSASPGASLGVVFAFAAIRSRRRRDRRRC